MFWTGLIIFGLLVGAVVLAIAAISLVFSFLGFILETIIGCFED